MDKTTAKPRTGLIAALDVGATKLCCFIARGDESGLKVVGVGHQKAAGMRAGDIIDMEAVETSVLAAVHTAETMAGERIRRAFVNVSCGRPASKNLNVRISVSGNEVSNTDVRRVLEEGRLHANGAGRQLIHVIPTRYAVDDGGGIRDPRGMYGQSLGVDLHAVTAGSSAVRNLTTCLSGCQLDSEAWVVTPYASALACLVDDETRLGATLVDMGGGGTTFAAFADGELVHTGVVPVGGAHVTNDLALGLNTPLADAERVKVLHGAAIAVAGDDQRLIELPVLGEEVFVPDNQTSRAALTDIIRPRLEETFEMLRERLDSAEMPTAAARRVVLTGGASQIQGLPELAAAVLDRQVRMARPRRLAGLAESVSGPAFATCAGLLRYGAVHGEAEPTLGAAQNGVFGRMGDWMRANL